MAQWQETLAQVAVAPVLPALCIRFNIAAQNTNQTFVVSATSANRLAVTVLNEGSTDLYLGLGPAPATLTDYTVKLIPGAYYEVPFQYTGQVEGIWAGSPTGFARVTELRP